MSRGIVLLSFYITFFISACTDTNTKSTKVFHYNQPNIITSLDPAFAKTQNNYWAIEHTYNQLLDLNDSMKIVPEIASSYSISSDGLTYTFKIRTDIYFHNDICFKSEISRRLNAEDVRYSFYRLLSPELSAPGRWIFLGKVDSLHAFEASNDSTFVIHLANPFSPFLSLLTMHYCSIVAWEAVDYYASKFAEHPVGTGPFKLKKWANKQGLFLIKNENYYKKGLPLLDGIRISFIEDRNTAYLEFMKKRIDFFSGLQSSFAMQIITRDGKIREDRKDIFNLYRGNYLNTEYIGINLSQLDNDHPLRNKLFRQALNYAIDRKLMIKTFKYGVGTCAESGFIPPGLPSFDSVKLQGYSYNPKLARKLLSDIRYSELYKDSHELILYTNKDYLDLITFVARLWQEIGIKVKIELMETGTLREKMRSGSLTLFRASWIADYPDEESYLTVFYGSNPAPPNYTRFKNAQFDKLYENAIGETDQVKRTLLYQEMDQLIIEEAPVIFLFYDQIALFCQKNITGIIPNPLNLLKLERVDKKID
ncbi:MAG: ABC transporter substrate-binding protein [Saprospiraceae bacterium]